MLQREIQFLMIFLYLQKANYHSVRFHITFGFISFGVLMKYQTNVVFVCPVYSTLLFVFA